MSFPSQVLGKVGSHSGLMAPPACGSQAGALLDWRVWGEVEGERRGRSCLKTAHFTCLILLGVSSALSVGERRRRIKYTVTRVFCPLPANSICEKMCGQQHQHIQCTGNTGKNLICLLIHSDKIPPDIFNNYFFLLSVVFFFHLKHLEFERKEGERAEFTAFLSSGIIP